MQYKSYKEIAPQLERLNRTEQYPMLLQTKDWLNFRNIILDRDGYYACTLWSKERGTDSSNPHS